jgi:hypothetical protein
MPKKLNTSSARLTLGFSMNAYSYSQHGSCHFREILCNNLTHSFGSKMVFRFLLAMDVLLKFYFILFFSVSVSGLVSVSENEWMHVCVCVCVCVMWCNFFFPPEFSEIFYFLKLFIFKLYSNNNLEFRGEGRGVCRGEMIQPPVQCECCMQTKQATKIYLFVKQKNRIGKGWIHVIDTVDFQTCT